MEDACCAFLTKQLDPSNCLGITKFAETHGCVDLHSAGESYSSRHFLEVVQNEEFLNLSAQEAVKMIERDDLEVKILELKQTTLKAELWAQIEWFQSYKLILSDV